MGKHHFNIYILKFSFYSFFLLFFYPLVDKPIGGGKHQNMPILRHILNIFNYFFVFLMVEHSLFCPIDGGVYLCSSFSYSNLYIIVFEIFHSLILFFHSKGTQPHRKTPIDSFLNYMDSIPKTLQHHLCSLVY